MICRLNSVIHSSFKNNLKLIRCFQNEKALSSIPEKGSFGSLKVPLENAEDSKARSAKISSTTVVQTKKSSLSDKVITHQSFGDLSINDPHFKLGTDAERNFPEDGDSVPSQSFKPLDIKRKRFRDYAIDIMTLSRQRKLKEAIELFESLAGLGVTYEKKSYLYSVIISACGKQGYTKKAFQIYAKLRQHGIRPSASVLTGLFNSCAECPFSEYGLEKARGLHRKMHEEGWQVNEITYHAMIKAYGRCGDLASAFLLVDEMKSGKHAITAETFAFLLQACISDKEAGFSHTVGVLRKMRVMKIKPTIHNYNLLLRAVRDCGVGPSEVASKLLLEWADMHRSPNHTKQKLLPRTKRNSTGTDPNSTEIPRNDVAKLTESRYLITSNNNSIASVGTGTGVQLQEVVFDLLAPRPGGATILALGEVKTSADKLALLGGPERILQKLQSLREKPNIQTATLLLECQYSSPDAEMSLLRQLKELGVTLDIDFFNVLIKKRCSRSDYLGAREVLNLISENGLYVDIATFGTLAMSCNKRSSGTQLLNDMEKSGFRPNIKILGALMKNAFSKMDLGWINDLMQQTTRHDISPCEKFLKQLEEAWKDATHATVSLERGKTVPAWAEADGFKAEYKQFCLNYKKWLKSVKVDVPDHPWKQFEVDKQRNN